MIVSHRAKAVFFYSLFFLVFCLFITQKVFAEKKVILRALDKTTGHVSILEAAINEEVTFGSLLFKIQNAAKNPPEDRPEIYVYITIWDMLKRNREDRPREIFKNWMFGSSPALSALDHPLYDLWIIDYKEAAGIKPPSKESSKQSSSDNGANK